MRCDRIARKTEPHPLTGPGTLIQSLPFCIPCDSHRYKCNAVRLGFTWPLPIKNLTQREREGVSSPIQNHPFSEEIIYRMPIAARGCCINPGPYFIHEAQNRTLSVLFCSTFRDTWRMLFSIIVFRNTQPESWLQRLYSRSFYWLLEKITNTTKAQLQIPLRRQTLIEWRFVKDALAMWNPCLHKVALWVYLDDLSPEANNFHLIECRPIPLD